MPSSQTVCEYCPHFKMSSNKNVCQYNGKTIPDGSLPCPSWCPLK